MCRNRVRWSAAQLSNESALPRTTDLDRLDDGPGWMTPICQMKDLPLGGSTTCRRDSLEQIRFLSGFRRRRSTVNNLVTLETSIRDVFVGRKHLVSIFYYLEKAYDTTRKHGILLDLYKTGRLPMFICDFFYLIVILKFVSGTYYTLILTHRRQVCHRLIFFPSRYLVSR